MPALADAVENVLLSLPPVTDAEANIILAEQVGRGPGGIGPRFRDWLDSNPGAFPEPVRAEYVDNPNDSGIDVLLEGRQTFVRIGFQIKSDNDLRSSHFTREVKAQITDSQAWDLSQLVIVLACRPTLANQRKYLFLQNELERWPQQRRPLVLSPKRAAAIVLRLDTPIQAPTQDVPTWPRFFVSVNQPALAGYFLDNWPALLPNDRFQPPDCFDDLLRASRESPITVLSGPPASGKTFTAIQVLWAAYSHGRPISWITPAFDLTYGPVPQTSPARILATQARVRDLGIRPNQAPIDSHDFIARYLHPGSLTYIEDPFGKTPEAFDSALHRYPFFNLDAFTDALQSPTREKATILISTMDYLFDRWRSHSNPQCLAAPNRIVQMSRTSYSFETRYRGAVALATAVGAADPEGVAQVAAASSDYPFEIELLCKNLPTAATKEDASAASAVLGKSWADQVAAIVEPHNDAEVLFLLLFVALARDGLRISTLRKYYAALSSAVLSTYNSEALFDGALQRFRSVLTYHQGIDRPSAPEEQPRKRGLDISTLMPNLWPTHASVVDAMDSALKGNHREFACRVGAVLSDLDIRRRESRETGGLALYLLSMGLGTGDACETSLRAIVSNPRVFETEQLRQLAAMWARLDQGIRDAILGTLDRRQPWQLAQLAMSLGKYAVQQADVWAVYRVMTNQKEWGNSFIGFGHPWDYFFGHVKEAPADLVRALGTYATESPDWFAYHFGEVVVAYWSSVPDEWRATLFTIRELDENEFVGEQIHSAVLLAIARGWAHAPTELKGVFFEESRHPDSWRRRANAAVAAMLYYGDAPTDFEDVLSAAERDSDIEVPLEVLRFTGNEERSRVFAMRVYERGDPGAVAAILSRLLKDLYSEPAEWRAQLLIECAQVGQPISDGVLAYARFTGSTIPSVLASREVTTEPEEASAAVQLAWLWHYAGSDGGKPGHSVERALNMLSRLDGPYRECALFYLSMQASRLPKEIGQFLGSLDSDAVRKGSAERVSAEGVRTTLGYPALWLGQSLAEAATGQAMSEKPD